MEDIKPNIKQVIQQILLGIVDEIIEVANEEKAIEREEKKEEWKSSGVVRRLILPLLQQHSVEPISTISPSPASHIVQPRVLKQKKNDSCGYEIYIFIFI